MRTEFRQGGTRPCPQCAAEIRYAVFNVHTQPMPYFYSISGSALLLRHSDRDLFREVLQQFGENEEKLRELAIKLLSEALPAPDGSKFDLWANIRCPNCGFEFPYNGGIKSVVRRISDSKIVLIDGTTVIGDRLEECYVLRVDNK